MWKYDDLNSKLQNPCKSWVWWYFSVTLMTGDCVVGRVKTTRILDFIDHLAKLRNPVSKNKVGAIKNDTCISFVSLLIKTPWLKQHLLWFTAWEGTQFIAVGKVWQQENEVGSLLYIVSREAERMIRKLGQIITLSSPSLKGYFFQQIFIS